MWNIRSMGSENPDAGWRQKMRAAICERRSPKDSPHWGLSTIPLAAGEWEIRSLRNHAERRWLRQ
jgi:hypothetical protein